MIIKRKIMKMLTAKEEEIMGYFWEKGPLFVKQLLENTYQYYAVVSCDDFKKKTLKGVISKYFNNSYLGAVSSLVKEEEISLDELKQLIRDVEKAHE